MSSAPIISVENLGKRYRLHHEAKERYTTLRDVIARKAKRLFQPRDPDAKGQATDGDFWALKDVSFEIKQGEVVGIIGRNGAGKSTLLKILSRITEPTEGRITLRGRVASLLEVGTGFHPELTGRENIFLNGAILGMSKQEIRSKFDEIVAFAEVERFLDTPVKRYSSGMYVRLAFAVAAHLEPEILIIDEVLAVGDAQFQKKCLGKMQDVSQSGRTILYVSHDMSNIAKLCSRGIFLNAGHVEFCDSMPLVVARYLKDEATGQSTGSTSDLSKRRDRSGLGGAHFEQISLLLHSKHEQVFPFGEDMTIELMLRVDSPLGDAHIEVKILTEDGIPVHSFENANEGFAWNAAPGKHRLAVKIPNLRLAPGKYAINLWLGDSHATRVDYVQRAVEFHIAFTAEHKLSRPYTRESGLVFVHSEWANLES